MSRRITALLTTDVNGEEVIVYRGEVYRKQTVRTRMADAGKHCVDVFSSYIGNDRDLNTITSSMLSAGTIMSQSTSKNYLNDLKRMCEGKKPIHIPEARIRKYAWEMNAVSLLKKFDEFNH